MNNNQLINKKDISFFDKIKRFFNKIFNKKTNLNENNNIQEIDNKDSSKINDNIDDTVLNTNIKKEELKDFLDQIDKNPSILLTLSNEKLNLLIEYYEDIISLKEKEVERLLATLKE